MALRLFDRITAVRFVLWTFQPYRCPVSGRDIVPSNPSLASRVRASLRAWFHAPAGPGVDDGPEEFAVFQQALWALRPASEDSDKDQWVAVYSRS